ncbi:MAG: hypothetical protein HUJ98_03850, partial [Bacteroidaceae bacterium]|nr:hypothetical protein [Bacteroidaceae bacterium]
DIYYVPFIESEETQYPIWRDLANNEICFANPNWNNIPDSIDRTSFKKESATKHVDLGEVFDQVQMDVYRPVELREVYQNDKLIEYHSLTEEIRLPFIVIGQFKIRDFDTSGVHEYDCKDLLRQLRYSYSSFQSISDLAPSAFTRPQQDAAKLFGKDVAGKIMVYLTDANSPIQDLYGWDYSNPAIAITNFGKVNDGIEFQSLRDNPSPRHYHSFNIAVTKEDWDDWDDSTSSNKADCLSCFKVGMEHGVYFFIFEALRKAAAREILIKELFVPLMKEQNYNLFEQDTNALYRLAREFHFDWMLLARDKWEDGISSINVDDKEKAKKAIEAFFKCSPKITDDKERFYLSEFLDKYWEFQQPTGDDISTTALNMILGNT